MTNFFIHTATEVSLSSILGKKQAQSSPTIDPQEIELQHLFIVIPGMGAREESKLDMWNIPKFCKYCILEINNLKASMMQSTLQHCLPPSMEKSSILVKYVNY